MVVLNCLCTLEPLYCLEQIQQPGPIAKTAFIIMSYANKVRQFNGNRSIHTDRYKRKGIDNRIMLNVEPFVMHLHQWMKCYAFFPTYQSKIINTYFIEPLKKEKGGEARYQEYIKRSTQLLYTLHKLYDECVILRSYQPRYNKCYWMCRRCVGN